MIGKDYLTAEQQQWLIENYRKMTKIKCAKELGVSVKVLRNIAKQLGIWSAPAPKAFFAESKPVNPKYDNGKGCCIDCIHYRNGGVCAKSSRITGALHKKNCFTTNKD